MYYLRVKAKEYGLKQKFSTTECKFMALVKQQCDDISKKKCSFEDCALNENIKSVIIGTSVEYGRPWAECEYVYMPLDFGHHWVLLVLDIGHKQIQVYDSRNRTGEVSIKWGQYMQCMEVHLAKLMDFFGVYNDRVEGPIGDGKLEVNFVLRCPRQKDGYSSGIFILKMAENLMMGRDVLEVKASDVVLYRKKFTIELLHYYGVDLK
ncbi:unnamed protein product [Cuscuta epithymum]|uniref:Ubiquitin-like protease family profile domain-containing protein n=1 Tax=Cuscuta epithymum TaxID=186058 RepID=A0AAV0FSA9_9ASTE|nr:unnamed protein product [Cuscuta epithymum]CAH9138065.1 unnamed protein product [Cuscuta epithymum]